MVGSARHIPPLKNLVKVPGRHYFLTLILVIRYMIVSYRCTHSPYLSGPRVAQIFYYTTPRTFCQGKMLHKFLYKKSQNFVRFHKFHLRIVQSDEILIIFLCNFYVAILQDCDIIYIVSER